MPQHQNRRLAAILFTDIVGYTDLMQRDEALAVATVNHHQEVLEAQVAIHHGEVLNYFGDGSLSIFKSALQAMRCAVDIQLQLQMEPKVPLRIGLHIGEILFSNGQVLGDAVNIASRIESTGVAGAILFSEEIHDKIRNKSEFEVKSLGPFEFKNVEKPMTVYALANEGIVVPKRTEMGGKIKTKRRRVDFWPIGIFIVVLAFALGYFLWPAKAPPSPYIISDAIAVFPFDVKGSPDIQYLGEGIMDLISTKLDEIPGINSIDPNMLFSRLEEGANISRQIDKAAGISNYFGAAKFILGSIVELDEVLQITASKYNVTGKLLDRKNVEHQKSAQLAKAIDELVKQLVAEEMGEQGQELSTLAALTSENLRSLKPYLQGEQAFRKGNVNQAFDYFKQATQFDSTFALAWMRMVDANSYNLNVSVPNAYKNWKRYKHKLPGKWQEYQDAYSLYLNADQKAIPAFEKLIRKYGPSKAFYMGLGEYLFHFNPVYGKPEKAAKPFLLKTMEFDPYNVEAFNHLSDIARSQKDTAAIREMLSSLQEDSELYPYIKINELILRDSVSDGELKALVNHPGLQRYNIFKSLIPLDDGSVNIELANRVLDLQKDKIADLPFNAWKHGMTGQERVAFSYFRKWVESDDEIFLPLEKYERCMPATIMAGKSFMPLSGYYELLLNELQDKDSPWEMYAAIKYNLALDKQEEGERLKVQMLEKAKDPAMKNQVLYYHFSIEAYQAWLANDNERALVLIDSAYQYPFGYWEIQTSCFDKSIMLASIYAEQEDYETAISYFENLPCQIGFEYIYGYTIYQLSQWYEQIGNEEKALNKCELFLKMYRDCDPEYRPWLEETKKRVERLTHGNK